MKINKDFLDIFIIALILVIFFFLFKSNLYFPLSDIGREFFIPSEMAHGKVLYRDIFNVYAPLGYLINSFIVKLFGNSLKIFYLIGFFLSFLVLTAVYKVSKLYTNRIISLLLTIFIMVSCTFYPSISNWITPYSYSIMYALVSILWALYFVIKYIDKKENIYLYLSSILYGFSISCKYEYILFVFIILIAIIYKKDTIKNLFISFLLVFIFPVLSIIILLIQKASLMDLLQSVAYSVSLSRSISAKFFYMYSGVALTPHTIKSVLLSFINPHFVSFFFPIIFISIITVFFIGKHNFRLLLLCITALFLSFKVLGGITFEIYGTYFFPILFISFIAFLYFKNIKKEFLISVLLLLIAGYSYFIICQNNLKGINTQKGTIKVKEEFKAPITDMTEFVLKTEKEDKILILPEGVFINYLTDKETDDFLFYLIPPHLEILKDEFVINKIKNGNYKYIAISNIMYPWFNKTSFLKSSGKNITDYIKSNYEQTEIIGEKFKFYIYEKK